MAGVPYIAVIGADDSATAAEVADAAAVGAALALQGAVVVCGGLGGVMEGACRGAHETGGRTVGILPGSDRAAANPFVDIAIPTGMGELRNGLIVRAADAVIAVGGAFGTLSEIALALRTGTPVVGLGTWELARDGRAEQAIVRAADAQDAAARALELAGSARRCRPPGPESTRRSTARDRCESQYERAPAEHPPLASWARRPDRLAVRSLVLAQFPPGLINGLTDQLAPRLGRSGAFCVRGPTARQLRADRPDRLGRLQADGHRAAGAGGHRDAAEHPGLHGPGRERRSDDRGGRRDRHGAGRLPHPQAAGPRLS